MQNARKHFFISYNQADLAWAEWIAWQIEEAGYNIILQAWDFRPGANFVLEMDEATKQAERTILVLSPDYLTSKFTQPEWAAAFRRDPEGKQRTIIPIQVRKCELAGLLAPIIHIDLVGYTEAEARERLLSGLRDVRAKPTMPPAFPESVQHSFLEIPPFPTTIWTVPYRRNPYFTGQHNIFTQLDAVFSAKNTPALIQPLAISGLGGIGKTQIAIEYAYRHRDKYQATFWVRADSRESLILDYVALANKIGLAKDASDQIKAVEAVRLWLEAHNQWLLILDNADNVIILDDFLPTAPKGHILLTTQAQAYGMLAHGIPVDQLPTPEGALLLLHRAKVLRPDENLEQAAETDRTAALQLAQLLAGLPLALDQAGAYIEETQCGVVGYLQRYRTQQKVLLQRRGKLVKDHPEAVTTTWSLSFMKIEQINPTAINLLRLSAFLHPDTIPEELFTEGIDDADSELQILSHNPVEFDDAIETLCNFSFIHRHADTQTFSIHRLVQIVLQDSMSQEQQHQWAEQAVNILKRIFPNPKDPTTWARCKRYILHAQTCTTWITNWKITTDAAVQLLNEAGVYLDDFGQYQEAELFYQQALNIHEQLLGHNHPDTASSLNNLATLYYKQGKYDQAEILLQQALAIDEQVLGGDHPNTARSLNNLAHLYMRQGKYDQAEVLLQRALSIREQVLGANHPDTAISLSNLAKLYDMQAKYDQAEIFFQRTLSIREQALGPNHPKTAISLNNLGYFYYTKQDKYDQAEHLLNRALTIQEHTLGLNHSDLVATLNNLATVYSKQEKYDQAETLYQRALSIQEQTFGSRHPDLAATLNNLAAVYSRQEKYDQAKELYQRALSIQEQTFGSSHPNTTKVRDNYTALLEKTGT